MAQDFAKQRQPTGMRRKPVRAATKTTALPRTSHWSWFFSGLTAGIAIAVGAWLGMLRLDAEAADTAIAAAGTVDPTEVPQYVFDFYDELAHAEVTVPGAPVPAVVETLPAATAIAPAATTTTAAATEAPSASSPAPTEPPAAATPPATTNASPAVAAGSAATEEKPVNYLLQAGSYQSREDAERQRARIIMLNMTANVSEGVVSGRTFYRVQVGPFAGRGNAENARNALAENSIESIPLLMR